MTIIYQGAEIIDLSAHPTLAPEALEAVIVEGIEHKVLKVDNLQVLTSGGSTTIYIIHVE